MNQYIFIGGSRKEIAYRIGGRIPPSTPSDPNNTPSSTSTTTIDTTNANSSPSTPLDPLQIAIKRYLAMSKKELQALCIQKDMGQSKYIGALKGY